VAISASIKQKQEISPNIEIFCISEFIDGLPLHSHNESQNTYIDGELYYAHYIFERVGFSPAGWLGIRAENYKQNLISKIYKFCLYKLYRENGREQGVEFFPCCEIRGLLQDMQISCGFKI